MNVSFHSVLFDRLSPVSPVFDPAVGRELREPEVVLGWSTLDYARSTAITPNTEMRPGIPGDFPAAPTRRNLNHCDAGRRVVCEV
jgi:hypothetical protein